MSSRPDEKVRERLKMARSRSGQDLYGNAFRSVLWLIISMLPASASSVPNTDEHNREREEREGDSNPLATPEGTPGDRNASQGLVAAAQDQQQQGVHNNNSFSLSSSGRTTPAEAVIDTPLPPLPAPTGAMQMPMRPLSLRGKITLLPKAMPFRRRLVKCQGKLGSAI